MKKSFKTLLAAAFILVGATALAGELKVGATPVPHAELLNLVKEDLKTEGVDLKVVEFTDYVTPNLALAEGELDANFFQHFPYLEKFSNERGLNLVSAGKIHVEPLGVFSQKIKDIKDLPNKATIAIPSDPSNGGRALILLHNNGIIKLNDPTNLYVTEFDIVENPKKLKFKPIEAAQLPRVLPDVEAAVINGNYALEAGFSPVEDSLLLEGAESPYANIIAVKSGDESKEDIQKLLKALQSKKVSDYIGANYKGGVVPAF
ncbi:MAG: MetQ/NlpA family ABC transporter substrate-binding protein [Fusobacterium sp.]|jgi:D-methionine transport system substrate-binding protein|uniref:MetQ/NlpA family ABC transporter substrate-binding protein n=1 Tax=Fusobacterium sp. TaxID=68766 RepID=UPI0025DA4C1F|nr:MetQ/NlpA family ABC transporter substrate-binding protein [uncultured Fusobacterium sp.]MCF2640462.1 MetQ/NlpA family ABC transporter substrate-binding protein [Fusobacterium varium]